MRGDSGASPDERAAQITTGLMFPEGPIGGDDGSVMLVEMRPRHPEPGHGGRHGRSSPSSSAGPTARPSAGRGGVPVQQRRLLHAGRLRWAPPSPAPCADVDVGGRIQRVDMATGGSPTLYTESSRHALRAPERHRVRRRRRVLVHRPRHARPNAPATGPASTTPSPRASRSRGRVPSSPQRDRPVAGRHELYLPRPTPAGCTRRRSPHPGCRPDDAGQPTGRPPAAPACPGLQLLDSLAVDGAGNVCVGTLGQRRHHASSRRTARPWSTSRCRATACRHQHLLRRTPRARTTYITMSATGSSACDVARPGLNRLLRPRGPRPAHAPWDRWAGERRATGWRPWAAPRTRSTPTSWRARCSPTAWSRRTRPRTPTSSSSTPAPSSRRPGRSRSTPSWPWPPPAAPAPAWSSPAAWPSATASELADALPEVDPVAGFGVPVKPRAASRRTAGSRAQLRPAQPAPAEVVRAVGLREGRRGVRPHLRVLRHPVVPGPAASRTDESILAEVDGSTWPRSSWWPRTSPPTGATSAGERAIVARSSRRSPPGLARPAAVPVPVRARRRPVDVICATGVPYFDLSLQHVVQAPAAPDAALGRRRPVPGPDRRHPPAGAQRRLPVVLHRRLPGRDRGRPRPAARLRRGGPARLGRLLRLLGARMAPTPPSSTAPSPAELMAERLPSCGELQDRITARRRATLVGDAWRSSSTSPAWAAATARRPRSTGSSPCRDAAGRRVRRVRDHRRRGPRPGGRPA